MTYPTNSSIIDMRSKINRPSITKTTLILKELDKLTSQSAVKVCFETENLQKIQ